MKTYAEKLKDPRWQKKRLEILQRDGFECRVCYDTESTLHVHHRKYEKGKEPWEYENDNYVTLCESCHDAWHYIDNYKLDWSNISLVIDFMNELDYNEFRKFADEYEKKHPESKSIF